MLLRVEQSPVVARSGPVHKQKGEAEAAQRERLPEIVVVVPEAGSAHVLRTR